MLSHNMLSQKMFSHPSDCSYSLSEAPTSSPPKFRIEKKPSSSLTVASFPLHTLERVDPIESVTPKCLFPMFPATTPRIKTTNGFRNPLPFFSPGVDSSFTSLVRWLVRKYSSSSSFLIGSEDDCYAPVVLPFVQSAPLKEWKEYRLLLITEGSGCDLASPRTLFVLMKILTCWTACPFRRYNASYTETGWVAKDTYSSMNLFFKAISRASSSLTFPTVVTVMLKA